MKIFKIKFDSKMPTTRKVTVGKDDDFGLAIQIDDMQTQGPAKLLYAGQEVEANKDLIEGYNVFLLKAIKDSTIDIKDIDSQVTFQVDISIKKTDVVELGGTGSGGESVWQTGEFDYYIDNAISVNNCQKVTITGSKDQVILKGLCDDASYEIENGNLILNTPKGIQINGTCNNDTPYIGLVTPCGCKTSFIDFRNDYLNLAYDSGNCSKNAICIAGSGICIDSGYGNLTIKTGNCINLDSSNSALNIESNKEMYITAKDMRITTYCAGLSVNVENMCVQSYKTIINAYNCINLSSSNDINLSADNIKIGATSDISEKGHAVKLETLSGSSINVGLVGCSTGYANQYIGIRSKYFETCAGEQYYTYICGQQVIKSNYSSDAKTNQFGNCNMTTNMFGCGFSIYTSNNCYIINASEYGKTCFGNNYNGTIIEGSCIKIYAANTCGWGYIYITPNSSNQQNSVIFAAADCTKTNADVVRFVLPPNLEFHSYDYPSGICTMTIRNRSKVFLTLLSALEEAYHNSCANDDTNYQFSEVDTVMFNKLSSLFTPSP